MKALLKLTKPGRRIPDPKTGKPIGPEGISVTLDDRGKLPEYFRRRVKDGDLTVEKPSAPQVRRPAPRKDED